MSTKMSEPRELFLHELGDVFYAERTLVKTLNDPAEPRGPTFPHPGLRGRSASDLVSRVGDIWGERTPFEGEWPVRVDGLLQVPEAEVERWVQSACVLCSNGCGLDIAVKDGRIVGVRGRAEDRVNHGRLGPKGRRADRTRWARNPASGWQHASLHCDG